jgi:hypothetical protein
MGELIIWHGGKCWDNPGRTARSLGLRVIRGASGFATGLEKSARRMIRFALYLARTRY